MDGCRRITRLGVAGRCDDHSAAGVRYSSSRAERACRQTLFPQEAKRQHRRPLSSSTGSELVIAQRQLRHMLRAYRADAWARASIFPTHAPRSRPLLDSGRFAPTRRHHAIERENRVMMRNLQCEKPHCGNVSRFDPSICHCDRHPNACPNTQGRA
jgi:hypothetical protein